MATVVLLSSRTTPSPPASLLPTSASSLPLRRCRRRNPILAVSSDPPKPVASSSSGGGEQDDDQPVLPLLQELADCLVLPPKFLSQLPRDLRLDLNDAAFDLSNGPVLDECGQEVGDLLLNLARAWEMADTSMSNTLVGQLPSMERFLTGSVKSAFGKRLVSAGRRFEAMGQYGEGELNRIGKTMVKNGKLLSRRPIIQSEVEAMKEKRKLKFGAIDFELTVQTASIGAVVALVFGLLSWQLSQGVQSIPEGSQQYANGNAMQLAKSLRGALLALSYTSTVLSGATSVGLLLLAQRLSSESKSE